VKFKIVDYLAKEFSVDEVDSKRPDSALTYDSSWATGDQHLQDLPSFENTWKLT